MPEHDKASEAQWLNSASSTPFNTDGKNAGRGYDLNGDGREW